MIARPFRHGVTKSALLAGMAMGIATAPGCDNSAGQPAPDPEVKSTRPAMTGPVKGKVAPKGGRKAAAQPGS